MTDESDTAVADESIETRERILGWLLDGDPAIRWQVKRDLLDAPADEVEDGS